MPLVAPLIVALFGSSQDPKPVEVPFKTVDSAMLVDAKVNGKDVTLMFDTGFSGYVVCSDGINLGKPDGKVNLQDFVGQFQADTVSIKKLTLGSQSIPLDSDAAAVLNGSDYTYSYGTHCDGIMGFAVIQHSITEINFQEKKFKFYPKSFDITKRVPNNKTTFLSKLLPIGDGSLEMLVKTANGGQMILALDTGNGFYATTHKEVLDRVGLWPLSRKPDFSTKAYVASGAVDSFYVRMPKLSIYGVPVENSVWSIIDLPSSSASHDGTVGFGFLKNFNVIVDYERRRVWLEHFSGKLIDDAPAGPGLSCSYDLKKKVWRVNFVMKNGPAEKAGILVGDSVLSFDDKEYGGLGYERMQQILEGTKGSKLKLALSRDGQLLRKEVERIELVNEATKPN